MRISDWSSDVCSSDLVLCALRNLGYQLRVVDLLPLGAGREGRDDVRHGVPSVESSVVASCIPHGITPKPGDLDYTSGMDLSTLFSWGWRSDERRGGKGCVSKCSSWCSQYHSKQ